MANYDFDGLLFTLFLIISQKKLLPNSCYLILKMRSTINKKSSSNLNSIEYQSSRGCLLIKKEFFIKSLNSSK